MADDEGRRIPYRPTLYEPADMDARAAEFCAEMGGRRSVRAFSPEPVPRRLIELAVQTASTAPSGAHQQPWTFVAVGDPDTKRRIRIAAEAEERRSYESRMSEEWLDALDALGTGLQKPYLQIAPWLVVLFEQMISCHQGSCLASFPGDIRLFFWWIIVVGSQEVRCYFFYTPEIVKLDTALVLCCLPLDYPPLRPPRTIMNSCSNPIFEE